MLIKKINPLREKIINFLNLLVLKLDNSGNSCFTYNGEKYLSEEIKKYYRDKNFVLFDVGANLGEYAKLFDHGELHLFEPQAKCFETLKQTFASQPNVFLNNFGLSDSQRETEIFFDQQGSTLGSLYQRDLHFYQIELDQSEKIQLKRADQYIAEKNLKKINLLKIDVEGHEYQVLQGFGDFLNNNFIDFVQFEYGGCNIDSRTMLRDLFGLLKKRGFALFKIKKDYLEHHENYQPRYENFAFQNWLAISKKILKYESR